MVRIPQPYSSVAAYAITATDDLLFRVINTDLWLSNANIHIVTNDALYGNVTIQPATATAGDILIYDTFNLADLYFRNAGAAANTTIYVVGIVMPKQRMHELGLV